MPDPLHLPAPKTCALHLFFSLFRSSPPKCPSSLWYGVPATMNFHSYHSYFDPHKGPKCTVIRWPHAVRNMQLLNVSTDLHTDHSFVRHLYQMIIWFPTQKFETWPLQKAYFNEMRVCALCICEPRTARRRNFFFRPNRHRWNSFLSKLLLYPWELETGSLVDREFALMKDPFGHFRIKFKSTCWEF